MIIKKICKICRISILNKVIFAFLLVMTPLYVLSLMMNKEGTKSVRDEISKSVTASIHFYLNAFETEISRTRVLQQELLVNKDLIKLSALGNQMTPYEKSQAILRILDQMNMIQRTGVYIDSINIYIPLIKRTLTTGLPLVPLSEEDFVVLFQSSAASPSPVIQWKKGVLSTVVNPSPLLPGHKLPQYLISVNYSFSNVEQSLLQFMNYDQGGALIVHPDWHIAKLKNMDPQNLPLMIQSVEKGGDLEHVTSWDNKFIFVSQKSNILGAVMAVFVPEQEVFGPLVMRRNWFWMLCGLSACIIIFFSFGIYRMVHSPLIVLVRAFRRVEKGELDVSIDDSRKDEFHYLFMQFNAMVRQLKFTLREVYEQRILAQRAKLKLLQSQINPHFLYNSFFILNEMVRKHNDEQLDMFTGQLGKYFQYITRNAMDHVTLETEVEHVRAYTSIQGIRFSKRVQVHFGEMPDSFKAILVPRMILQPIVENAFQHSLDQKVKNGHLYIQFVDKGEEVEIIVEDNGDVIDDDQLILLQSQVLSYNDEMESTGIFNVHRRLQLMFGDASGIELTKSQYGGLAVKIIIVPGGERSV
ncbi:sensor histidine kinase [Paenibacillus eucommiae]|uniref:Two-component system sensor histidine kinase YesM n=1 Tax=Paenibacillus eucommiae TaxID=1355755 RepID=A0ABS4IPX3_9BACL|nr:histidine kinase [Paenibacillus eucommiae]MBP1989071.1 two-component system sensor histidine kinase YesM [Paenibacillus eucommiae]